MRSLFARLAVVALAALVQTGISAAAAPSSINYQGVLTDAGGDPQVGTFSVTFSLYGFEALGSPIWTEMQNVTTDSEGRFSVALGASNPLDASSFGIGERWLGIKVESDPEMSPRQKIHSVAYALRTQTLDAASGGQILGNIDVVGEIQATGMSSKIRFHYNTFGDLPDPSSFHGAVGHVHDEGRLYFAHAGQWVPLANASELTTPSVLTAPDGDPDSAVVVDNDGNVVFQGILTGDEGPLMVGDSGLVINGGLIVNIGPINFNVIVNINNGANVNGGDLRIIGPAAALLIQNGARLRVQNASELELESGGIFVTRTGSSVILDAGTVWTSSAALITEAEIEIENPGYLRVHDATNTVMSDLRYDALDMVDGARTMELRTTDLTSTGGQFDINADKVVINTPVPVELVSMQLTGGGVSVLGGGVISTDPASQLMINGPSTFSQPMNAPVQIGVGPGGAGALHVVGNITATGAKLFVQDDPTDPTREIRYIALEAGEAGTYTRGTARLVDGVAVIDLPEHFSLVTGPNNLTAQITPRGRVQSMLYIESVTPTRLIVRASNPADRHVAFDYLVNGVRLGFENHRPIVEKPSISMN